MKKLLIYIIMCMAMAACSEVELCETPPAQHPHSSTVRYEFDWSVLDAAGVEHPDTMGVVNYRVVNNWKRLAVLSSKDLQGSFLKIDENGKVVPTPVVSEDDNKGNNDDQTTPGEENGDNNNADDNNNDQTDDNTTDTGTSDDLATRADGDGMDIDMGGDTGDDNDTGEQGDNTDQPSDGEEPDNGEQPGDNEDPTTDDEPAATRILPGEPTASPVRDFTIKPGEYKFMTLAYDTSEVDLAEVYRFIAVPPIEMAFSDIAVTYRTFPMDDKRLKNPLTGWDDYNGYAQFLQPDLTPVIYDTTDIVSIARDEHATVKLQPKQVSQNVDVYLNIVKGLGENNKYAFVVDSIWAEISGVSRRVNLSNSKLDIANTGKMMFPMEMWFTPIDGVSPRPSTDNLIDGKEILDKFDNEHLYCHANINVTGIVAPSDSKDGTQKAKDKEYGPGIMQLVVFTHYERTDRREVWSEEKQEWEMRDVPILIRRRLQGKANLYYPLTREPSVKLSEDQSSALRTADHINLRFDTSIPLSGKDITDPDTEGDVLKWKWYQSEPGQGDDVIIEI